MKKIISCLVVLMSLCIASTAVASKYDVIISNDPAGIKFINDNYKKLQTSKPVIDYLNLLLNRNDLLALAKDGRLDKDKADFIQKNTDFMVKFFQIKIVRHMISRIDPTPSDRQFLYMNGVIKGVIKSKRSGPEQEVQKEILRKTMPLYKAWEIVREPGFIEKMVNEEIDILYKNPPKK